VKFFTYITILVAATLLMLYSGRNHAWMSAVFTIRVLESTNHKQENTGAGHIFQSPNAKRESIPKPPYLSGIVTY
jgi:hypothetical protein